MSHFRELCIAFSYSFEFQFFRITKAQFQLQGWPLQEEDLDQRVKSCFNQVIFQINYLMTLKLKPIIFSVI